jgi:hypothetical protein
MVKKVKKLLLCFPILFGTENIPEKSTVTVVSFCFKKVRQCGGCLVTDPGLSETAPFFDF